MKTQETPGRSARFPIAMRGIAFAGIAAALFALVAPAAQADDVDD